MENSKLMSSETAAIETAAMLTLTLYGCIVLAAIIWQIGTFRQNWKAWLLYIVQRLHNGLMFQWRSNRKCAFRTRVPD